MEFETPTFAKKGNASLNMNWNLQYWERHRFSYVQKSTGGGARVVKAFLFPVSQKQRDVQYSNVFCLVSLKIANKLRKTDDYTFFSSSRCTF